MATDAEVEIGARAMYGKHWDGPADKMPGEKMKDVWRRYARLVIEAVDAARAKDGRKLVRFVQRELPPFIISE